jgi:hypothetical protein
MITDHTAQRTAQEWHGGGGSAIYAFASTGAITPDLCREIDNEITHLPTGHQDSTELANLWAYARSTGEREAVPDWYERVICHPDRVLIEVRGGIAEISAQPPGVDVYIIDHDEERR